MISVDEAQASVLGRTPTLASENVALSLALGRVLRAPAVCDRDLPPFNRAAMDGFAVRSADIKRPNTRLVVTGDVSKYIVKCALIIINSYLLM
jgi:molybdopterin molybdotransferase